MSSGKKVFTIDQVSTSHNHLYISTLNSSDDPDQIKHKFKPKLLSSIMIFGIVASDSKKINPILIDFGININTVEYIKIPKNLCQVLDSFQLHSENQDCVPTRWTSHPHGPKDIEVTQKNAPNFWPNIIWPQKSSQFESVEHFYVLA